MCFTNYDTCLSSQIYPCREALAELYRKLLLEYPIILLEDPFEEESFSDFTRLTSSVDCQVSGEVVCMENSVIKQ